MSRNFVTESADGAFWAGVRDKVLIARRQIAQGRTVDGESAMHQILAEFAISGQEGTCGKRKPMRKRRTARQEPRPPDALSS